MTDPAFAVPADLSFQEAIALTQSLLSQWEENSLTDTEIEATIAALVKTQEGARGFFVTYLTSDRPLADQPTPAVLAALRTAPDGVSDLLVKNLAMSAAMAVAHRRNQNEEMAQGSRQVQHRTIGLIRQLQLPGIRSLLEQLQQSVTQQRGDYQAFLQRWQYDAEQRDAIQQAVHRAIA
ncbi:MAG: hypothetical protein VKK04_22465 [Synechococcales bacterium]|nr:hypothetical protein [Synechococcales bacterium]